MSDLGTRIRTHYDRVAPAIDIEGLADRLEMESLTARRWRARRLLAIAVLAAIATVLAVGLPLWLMRGSDEPPVAPSTVGPTSTTLTTTTVPATTLPTTAPSVEDPILPTTSGAPAEPLTYTAPAGVAAGTIHQIVVAADGAVWAVGDGIARFADGDWHRVTAPEDFVFDGTTPPVGRLATVKAAAGPDGAVWFAHGGGIHRYRDGTWTAFGAPACGEGMCAPTTIAVTGDGAVWTAAADHVYKLDAGSWVFVTEDFVVTRDQADSLGGVAELVSGDDGSLWYSTFDEVVRYDGSETVISAYGFEEWPPPWTQVIGADGQGRAWVVVGYAEPDRYLLYVTDVHGSRTDWPTYALGDAVAVAVAPNGDVWIAVTAVPIDPWNGDGGSVAAVTEPGAYRLAATGWSRITTDHGLADNDVRSIAVTPDGDVWMATAGGITRFEPGFSDAGELPIDAMRQSEPSPDPDEPVEPSVSLAVEPYSGYHPEIDACVVDGELTIVGAGSILFAAYRVADGTPVELLASGDVGRYGDNPSALLSYSFPCDGPRQVEVLLEVSLIDSEGNVIASAADTSVLAFD